MFSDPEEVGLADEATTAYLPVPTKDLVAPHEVRDATYQLARFSTLLSKKIGAWC